MPFTPLEFVQFQREMRFVLADSHVHAADKTLQEAIAELNLRQEIAEEATLEKIKKKVLMEQETALHKCWIARVRSCLRKVEEAKQKKQEAYDNRSQVIDDLVMDVRERESLRRMHIPTGVREWERKFEWGEEKEEQIEVEGEGETGMELLIREITRGLRRGLEYLTNRGIW